tara:strand:+ start:477 stop:659 length:183 start_codon:yes stop_codon:yes gene_type:complete
MSIMQEPDRLVILTQMDASLTFLSIKSNDFSTGFGGFFTNFSNENTIQVVLFNMNFFSIN